MYEYEQMHTTASLCRKRERESECECVYRWVSFWHRWKMIKTTGNTCRYIHTYHIRYTWFALLPIPNWLSSLPTVQSDHAIYVCVHRYHRNSDLAELSSKIQQTHAKITAQLSPTNKCKTRYLNVDEYNIAYKFKWKSPRAATDNIKIIKNRLQALVWGT